MFIVLGVAMNSFVQVLGTFARKYVIDLVMLQAGSEEKDIMPLIKLIMVLLAVYIVVWGWIPLATTEGVIILSMSV